MAEDLKKQQEELLEDELDQVSGGAGRVNLNDIQADFNR